MGTKESLQDRLPYYWEKDGNTERLLSIIASPLSNAKEEIENVKISRRLKRINEGEEVANGDNLDKLGYNVGVVRDSVSFIDQDLNIKEVKRENDEMFRRRVIWNIDVQQSDATVDDIKELFAEGLAMFRVRTGFGGVVREQDLTPSYFDHPKGPKYSFPGNDLKRESVDISPSDVFVFQNRDTMTGGKAPDYYHGRFGELTNFYQIAIPWKAMPWADGDNDFRWVSEDDWPRPQLEFFTDSNLSSGILEKDNELEDTEYPIIDVYNSNGEKILSDEITSTGNTIQVDLSSYNISDEWSMRASGDDGHRLSFTSANLSGTTLTVSHNLNFAYPLVSVYDNNGINIDPNYVKYVDTNTVEVDLDGFTVNGTWHVTLAGGKNSRNYHTSFDKGDMTARRITFTHNLSVDSPNVQVFNDANELYKPLLVQHVDDDTTMVKFDTRDVVSGKWNIQITVDSLELQSDPHGWNRGVWGALERDLVVEPLRDLADLTRPAATEIGIYGYGGMVWRSEDDWDDNEPPEDELHGWEANWDGDVEEREYFEEQHDY